MSSASTTIRVALVDDVADWAHRFALSRNLSLSELISETVSEAMRDDHAYVRAMRGALKFRSFGQSTGPCLTSDETYDRSGKS